MTLNRLLPVAALLAASFVATVPSAQAALLKSYDFDGDLTDTLGNGLAMTANPGGVLAGGRYLFAVEMRFQVNDSTAGFNKLIDFQDLASDIGLYIFGGRIDFFTAGPLGSDAIALDSDVTVGLARAAGSISVFLNGVLQFSAVDGGEAVSGSNILNFFEDDTFTGQSEAFVGSVDWIRIHDDATTFGTAPAAGVPEPLTLVLTGLGLAFTGFASRRRG